MVGRVGALYVTMSSDETNRAQLDEGSRRLCARWEAASRRQRPGLDRLAVVGALTAATSGGPAQSVELGRRAAAFGDQFAGAGGSLAALVEELDALESIMLADVTSAAASPSAGDMMNGVDRLHGQAAWARRTAAAAFGHAVSSAGRKRVRLARHDIANAIGTVRNAILLMDDEAAEGAREHFRAIAKRNSRASEVLVRSQLSDQTALTPALGWENVSISDLVGTSIGDTDGARVVTDAAALETMLDAIRMLAADGTSNLLDMDFSVRGGAGVLRVTLPPSGDYTPATTVRDDLHHLAAALGLRVADDVSEGELSLLVPLSTGHEGNDLGGTGQSHNADTVRF